jgi:predicted metal-dependent hydrolase
MFRYTYTIRKNKRKKNPNAHYLKYKEEARRLVAERIAIWNEHYKVAYGRTAIHDTKTRWGSCSRKGNLNFNYKIVFLPPHLADYIIIHELCHLKEFNHSPKFWALVAQTMPDYRTYRKELRSQDIKLNENHSL